MKTTAADAIRNEGHKAGYKLGLNHGRSNALSHVLELHAQGVSFGDACLEIEQELNKISPAVNTGSAPIQPGAVSQPDMGDAVVALMLAERGEVTA